MHGVRRLAPAVDFLSVFKGKIVGVRIAEAERSRSRVGVDCGDGARHCKGFDRSTFVDDFEPAVAEPAQGIGVALVLLAMMLIVNLGPDAARETLLRKKVDGVAEVFVTSPALMNVPVFALFS